MDHYLVAYSKAIREKTPKLLYFGSHKARGIDLARLDSKYYERQFLDPHRLDDSWAVEMHSGLMEVAGWTRLRMSADVRSGVLSQIRRNDESLSKETLTRAANFLAERRQQLSFDTPATTLHSIIEGCMQLLCTLRGVDLNIASAIVASWTPFGVYRSDELVSNLEVSDDGTSDPWISYAYFYSAAIPAHKLLRQKTRSRSFEGQKPIETGREMEKIAWSIFHKPQPAPQLQSSTPGPSRSTQKRKSSTSKAPRSSYKRPKAASSRARRGRGSVKDIFSALADAMQEFNDYPSDAE